MIKNKRWGNLKQCAPKPKFVIRVVDCSLGMLMETRHL
jgi:hypothetical protein